MVCRTGSMKRLSVSLSVCPSVWLSRHSTAAAACGVFAAERRAGRRYRSIAAGRRRPAATIRYRRTGRSAALSSKCGQCHVGSRVDEAEHRLVVVVIVVLLLEDYGAAACPPQRASRLLPAFESSWKWIIQKTKIQRNELVHLRCTLFWSIV